MTYNLFISHSWAYSNQYEGLVRLLNANPYFSYKNYSVPKNDPIHNAPYAYCWSNLAQLNYLREHTCLFIGCSLTDPNLRRLLNVAKRNNEKPRHYAFLRRNNTANSGQVDQKALEIYKDIDLSLREKYYAEMGLNIIWADNFDEIPQILKGLL